MLWEILKAGRTNNSEDLFTRLAAEGISGAMNTSTVSGISPLVMPNCSGKPLISCIITGNTVQNGTPTPENPVEVLGCGDYDSDTGMYKIPVVTRGKNLFKAPMYKSKIECGVTWESNGDGTITVSGIASGYSTFMLSNAYPIPSNCIGQNLTFDYRISNVSNIVWDAIVFYDENNTEVVRYADGAKYAVTIKIEPNFKKVTALIKRQHNHKIIGTVGLMIEFGTKATTYEPYHEPITTPIYLPTPLYSCEVLMSDGSRDVKWDRLVMTGDEEITTHKVFEDGTVSIRIPSSKAKADGIIYCTHLQNVSFTEIYNNGKQGISAPLKNELNNLYCLISGFTKVTQYKDFFRNEYSAGTPVTVWYQLADPTTETVTVPRIQTIRSSAATLSIDTHVQPENVTVKYRR